MTQFVNILDKEDCPLAIHILRSLRLETRPEEGTKDLQAVETKWQWLEEIVTQMADQIAPGSSMRVKSLFDNNMNMEDLPF